MMTKRSLVTFGAALACAGLFGCGGGGGGGGGQPGLTPPPSTPIAISAANADQVTDASLDPAVGGTDAFDASNSSAATPESKPRALLRAMQGVSRQAKKPRRSSGLSDAPVNENCAFGGTITGDETPTSANLNFNACKPEVDEVINGTLSANVTENTATTFRATFNVNITFTQSGSQPLRVVGGFTINEVCQTPDTDCTGSFSGSSLGAQHGTEVWFISNFDITSAEGNGLITVTANYIVASSELNGSVTVNTTSPILIMPGMPYPHNGVIQVTGANSSRAVITINSNTAGDPNAVTVQFDFAPGDGNIDVTKNYSWTQLETI